MLHAPARLRHLPGRDLSKKCSSWISIAASVLPRRIDLVAVGAEDSTLHKWRRKLEAVGDEFIDPDAKSYEGGAGVRLRDVKAKR